MKKSSVEKMIHTVGQLILYDIRERLQINKRKYLFFISLTMLWHVTMVTMRRIQIIYIYTYTYHRLYLVLNNSQLHLSSTSMLFFGHPDLNHDISWSFTCQNNMHLNYQCSSFACAHMYCTINSLFHGPATHIPQILTI